MTVAELIAKLQAAPQDARVVVIDDWELRPVSGAQAYKVEGDFYDQPGEVRLGRGVKLGDFVVEIG
ncbi:hypothetical protein [Phenylobacterium kunshanense]|uniref:Uncharacterized protein n=1 Tax=Phenylobacterium kunshanense TaxID=1445034 RepID=A0A328BN72_9CAUL|nr:hypothetical protein [Phenylobacterium kunshanense]RAK68800.1 hypothetical protein DJ019_01955 [Phenylobacterium kunshanense]